MRRSARRLISSFSPSGAVSLRDALLCGSQPNGSGGVCSSSRWFSWPHGLRQMTFVNWAADPSNSLPTLPGPLALGQGDDPAVVEAHDLETRMYDELYAKGGWTRLRLQLTVARDPLPPTTQRQLLVMVGVVAAFVIWRSGRFS